MKIVLFPLLVIAVDAQNAIEPSSDKCLYSWSGYKCGDKCTDLEKSCECGGVTLNYTYKGAQFCCVKNGTLCTGGCSTSDINEQCLQGNNDTICSSSDATVIDISEPCHGRCYNDYHSSWFLGAEAHLTCSGGDKCIPLKEMCQGVDCTDTAEECSEEIRCIVFSYEYYVEVRNLTTPTGVHFYCQYSSNLNTALTSTWTGATRRISPTFSSSRAWRISTSRPAVTMDKMTRMS